MISKRCLVLCYWDCHRCGGVFAFCLQCPWIGSVKLVWLCMAAWYSQLVQSFHENAILDVQPTNNPSTGHSGTPWSNNHYRNVDSGSLFVLLARRYGRINCLCKTGQIGLLSFQVVITVVSHDMTLWSTYVVVPYQMGNKWKVGTRRITGVADAVELPHVLCKCLMRRWFNTLHSEYAVVRNFFCKMVELWGNVGKRYSHLYGCFDLRWRFTNVPNFGVVMFLVWRLAGHFGSLGAVFAAGHMTLWRVLGLMRCIEQQPSTIPAYKHPCASLSLKPSTLSSTLRVPKPKKMSNTNLLVINPSKPLRFSGFWLLKWDNKVLTEKRWWLGNSPELLLRICICWLASSVRFYFSHCYEWNESVREFLCERFLNHRNFADQRETLSKWCCLRRLQAGGSGNANSQQRIVRKYRNAC